MIDYLQQIDERVFIFFNREFTNSIFDFIFPLITDLHKMLVFKFIVLPILVGLVIWRRSWFGIFFLIGLTLSVAVTDWIGGKVIKPFFGRLRPTHTDLEVILRGVENGGFSFISNHAANIFCASMFIGLFFPKLRPYLFIYAAMVAYSRVYVGVHYPSDVVAGAFFGMTLGYIGFSLTRIAMHKFRRHHKVQNG